MDKIQVFIMHWARKAPVMHHWNDALLNCVRSVQRFTAIPHEIVVVYNCDPEHLEDLQERLPKDVRLEEDTRGKGASGGRNMCVDLAETDYFVLIDNDMKVPLGWLGNLAVEIRHAESYFRAPCVIRPSFMPYLEEPPITQERYHRVYHLQQFVKGCQKYGLACSDKGVVQCKAPWTGPIKNSGTGVTDNGWSLSIWIASRKAFDYIGYSDEDMCGWWGEDCEWAIRALKTPVKLLETNTVYLQHMQSFTSGPTANMRVRNADIFVQKHGQEILEEVISGDIWPRLHREQLELFPRSSGRSSSSPS